MREISAKGFTRLIGNGTEFKKVGVTYILAITCGFGFYPLHTYLNGRTIGAFDDICNIRHLFVAYFFCEYVNRHFHVQCTTFRNLV